MILKLSISLTKQDTSAEWLHQNTRTHSPNAKCFRRRFL